MKLTTAIARTLEPPSGKTDHIEWDDDFPGFGVRLRVGRNRVSRMWVYQYDFAGRTRRITLGNVNAIGIDDARKTAGQLQGKVRLGHDPVREKAETRAREALTFAAVMNNYLAAAKLSLRASTWNATESYLRRYCTSLHPLPFTIITRREIAAVLTSVATEGTLVTSNNVRAKLGALFTWAIGQGVIETNPVVGTIKHGEKSRERVLSLPELAAIWHALDDIFASFGPRDGISDYAPIVRLLMLTGLRAAEIGDLRWCEIHAEKTFIDDGLPVAGPALVLPPERSKNGRKHIVPLSKPAQVILLTRQRDPDGEFVFWRRTNDRALKSWHRRKTALDRALVKHGHVLASWVLHDLRRSVATHMGEMGIQPHIIECVLNHVGGFRAGVAGVYNKSKLEEPKRQALEAWGERLMAHIEGREPVEKVVPLRA